jgi:pimeloyl-ACP methyl ester carboxylesterase
MERTSRSLLTALRRSPFLTGILALSLVLCLCSGLPVPVAAASPTITVLPPRQAPPAHAAKHAVVNAATGSGLITNDLSAGSLTPTLLAQTLVGPGVSVSNAQFTGAPVTAGTFSGGNGIIGFDSGVVLSTGKVSSVVGPNVSDSTSTNNGQPGDPTLTALSGFPTFDAAILNFDFVPQASTVSFQYVFGSEEYNEFVNTQFNDVFGFFINGANCALVPGTTTPVAVNTINGGNPFGSNNASHPELYRNNELRDANGNFIGGPINTELDGLTTALTCVASVTPGATNHARLAIADSSDAIYDSDVFIKSGSLALGVPSRKVVVLLQGIDSSLTKSVEKSLPKGYGCPADASQLGTAETFSCIKQALESHGYNLSTDLLEFSYQSGSVDSSSKWVPNDYKCNDPSHFSLEDSANHLRDMLSAYANAHPNEGIHYTLIGHSLGGDVAFKYLTDRVTATSITGSPPSLGLPYTIDGVMTIDSQLDGYPFQSPGWNWLPHCDAGDPASGPAISDLQTTYAAGALTLGFSTRQTNSQVVSNAHAYGIKVFTLGDWYDTLQPLGVVFLGTGGLLLHVQPAGQTVSGADDTMLFNLFTLCNEVLSPGCGHIRLLSQQNAYTRMANDVGQSLSALASNPILVLPPAEVSGLGTTSTDPFQVPVDSPSATLNIDVCTSSNGCLTDPPSGTIVTLHVDSTTYTAATDSNGVAHFIIAPPLNGGVTGIYATYVDPTSGVLVTSDTGFYQFTLDTIPPTTIASAVLASNGGTYNFGTWTNQAVQVALNAADNPGGSGVAHTYYALDNPACTPTALATCTIYAGSPFSVSAEGNHTLTYFSVDITGNAEAVHTTAIQIDLTPPNPPTGHISPLPNAAGWNNTPAAVSFTGNGDAGTTQSGVASCTGPTIVSTETAGTAVTGTCTDVAGNTSAPTSVTVKLDSTAPHSTAALVPPPNAAGWNKGPVQVTLNATDKAGGSGVQKLAYGASGAQTIGATTVNGSTATLNVTVEGQTNVTYGATDVAGNPEVTESTPVKIDKTAPACALTGTGVNGSGQKYIQITVGDTGSGLGGIKVTTLNNANMPVNFTAGTTSPLVLTATKINQSLAAQVGLQVTDVAGNVTNCDPVMTDLIRDSSKPSTITATGIAQGEYLLHIYNGNPGLNHLIVKVNGIKVQERDLEPGEQRTVDIAAALQPGTNNTVVVIARGKQRGEATLVIADS